MWQALQQWFKPRAPARVPPAPVRTPVAAPSPAVSAVANGTVVGAHRPLVAADGTLAGFEFRVSPSLVQRLQRQGDGPATHTVATHVLAAMRLSLAPGRLALTELPAAWLDRCDATVLGPGMLIVTTADAQPALVDRLRARQVQVGWRTDGVPAGTRPDFLLASPAQAHGVPAWPAVPLVLPDLPDLDTLESVLRAPVWLAACQTAAAPDAPAGAALAPQTALLLRLLASLVRDQDHAEVVATIQSDAALSLRLLQHLNSAGASPGRTLASVDEAVTVLGRDALYRWCAHLLVRSGPARPAAPALQALALARGRLLEQLARRRAEPQPGRFFLFGLASLLPQLLRAPLDEALRSLRLPGEARQALAEGQGPWAPYLALCGALERADLDAARPLAEPFGGLPVVLAEATRSWR